MRRKDARDLLQTGDGGNPGGESARGGGQGSARRDLNESGESFGRFWYRSSRQLLHNLWMGSPVFLVLGIFLVVSAYRLHDFSHVGLGESFFITWMTMTTLGGPSLVNDAKGVITDGVRVLLSLDGFFGIVLIGTVVWIITKSLESDRRSS